MEELKFLEEQQVAPELIKRVEEFRSRYEVEPETAGRIVKPSISDNIISRIIKS